MEALKNNNKIELDKVRDFGAIFDVTVDFVKQNWIVVSKAVAIFVVPAALIAAIFANPIPVEATSSDPIEAMLESISSTSNLASIIASFGSFIVGLYTICYMSIYRRTEDGKVDSSQVWAKVKESVVPVIAAAILYFILVVIGIVLCLIPGIALAVYLAFYANEIVEENAAVTDSLKNSYNLVKDNWWSLFGFYIITAIIVAMIAGIFAVPLYIPTLVTAFGGVESSFFVSGIFIYVAALVAFIVQIFLTSISYMALTTYYYSLKTQKENREDIIDQIGSHNNGW